MNTAGRLLSTFEKLFNHRHGNDAQMLKVWAAVFDLSVDDPHLEDAVVVCLQATRSEIEALRVRLLAMGAPEELMQPGIVRFRNYTSTANIHASWNNFREEAAKPENRLAFMWANWTLRDESEDDMPAEELATLRSELDSLESSLQETDMTPYMRDFIQRQINTIRTALRLYRVRGVKPIEEALHQVAGAYTVEKPRVEAEHEKASESAKSVFTRAGAVIEKTAKVADNLDKIRKAGEGAFTLAAGVGPLLLTLGQNLLK